MSSRLARRVSNPAVRASMRPRIHNVLRRSYATAGESSAKSTGSDTPWMIGSAVVFGPLIFYFASPAGVKAAHDHVNADAGDHAPSANHSQPPEEETSADFVKDNEGTESSFKDEAGSDTSVKDDEGNEASASEVNASTSRAYAVDSPQDAQENEEKATKEGKSFPDVPESKDSGEDAEQTPASDETEGEEKDAHEPSESPSDSKKPE